MTKLCMFDMDGTLLNTLDTIAYYGNTALEKFGLKTAPRDEYKYFVGNGAKLLVERMLKYSDSYNEETFDKVYEYYNDIYNADASYLTCPYDGIMELVAELRNRGIKTAVLSNKPDYALKEAVKSFFGEGVFDYVQGQIEGIKTKPDPDGAKMILEKLGISAEDTVYVGDTWVDMKTGKGLGAYTIGVLWGFRDYEELKSNNADAIISKPSEVLDCIEKLNKNF